MSRRLRAIINNQKGFTLIELIVVVAITSLLSGAIAGTISQVFIINAQSIARMTAVKQVESAVHWLSRDMQMAQTIITNDSDPANVLILTWVEWDNTENVTVIYTLNNGDLRRNHSVSGQTIVAQHISIVVTPKPYTGGNLTFTTTATLGGLRSASETRVVEVIPRPGL